MYSAATETAHSSYESFISDWYPLTRYEYEHNWILDGQSPAVRIAKPWPWNGPSQTNWTISTRFEGGVPVGLCPHRYGPWNSCLVYNHWNFEILYREVEKETYEIVAFAVEPLSIYHTSERGKQGDTKNAKLNTTPSCGGSPKRHTSLEMIQEHGAGLVADGHARVFTYDVIWREYPSKQRSWWDDYFTMNDFVLSKVHQRSLQNGTAVLLVTVVIASLIFAQSLLPQNEVEFVDMQSIYRKAVALPPSAPLLLSVLCGSGAQLLSCFVTILVLICTGLLDPAHRGSTLTAVVVLFPCCGIVGGIVTSVFFSTCNGNKGKLRLASTLTATLFPGLVFVAFSLVQVVSWRKWRKLTYAVPPTIMVEILALWGLMIFLTRATAGIGKRAHPLGDEDENTESSTSSCTGVCEVRNQRWHCDVYVHLLVSSALPFCVCVAEFHFLLLVLWTGQDRDYKLFGYLVVAVSQTLAISACCSILLCHWQIRHKDHRWWWRAFGNGGAFAVNIWLYSVTYYLRYFNSSYLVEPPVLYFSYMLVLSVAAFLAGGFVGLVATLCVNKMMYNGLARSASQSEEIEEMIELMPTSDEAA